jgi:Skp family chaperone for outer membrane proteins
VKSLKLITILLFVFSATLSAQAKIGYVDSKIIMEKFSDAKKIKKKMEELQKRYIDEMGKLESEYEQIGLQLRTQRLTLTQAKLAELNQKLEQKGNEIVQFKQQKLTNPNGEFFVKVQEMQQPLYDKIFAAIKKVAAEKGLDLVVDNVNQTVILYTSEKIDYTDDVLAALEKTGN